MQEAGPRASIVAVAADKGGVGKTTVAYELAAALGGVLVDLDHHQGGATEMWRYKQPLHSAPLLDGLERGPSARRPPRVRRSKRRPTLLPSHRDLAAFEDLTDEDVADCLRAWAGAWPDRLVVVDTAPGDNPFAKGAISVADLILTPVPLEPKPLAALADMLEVYRDYQIVVVPNTVPRVPPRRLLDRLAEIIEEHDEHVKLAPWISDNLVIRRRFVATPISKAPRSGRNARSQDEFLRLAAYVERELWGDTAATLTLDSTLRKAS